MLLDFHFDEHLQFINVLENFVLRARQMLKDPGKDVVHLKDGNTVSCADTVLMPFMQISKYTSFICLSAERWD